MPTPLAKAAATLPESNSALASLIKPFEELAEDKRELLRDVLQIYVSKDAAQRTDLDKRHRVTALINAYAKGEEAGE